MDQNKLKQLVVEVLIIISTTSYAATETTNEPPSTVSPPPQNKPKINLKMVILLSCLITAFLLMCFFCIYFLRYAERQLALAATTGSDHRTAMNLGAARGLDHAVIAEFTSFKYSTVKDIKIGQHVLECAVCLNEFHDHEALRLLPECSHVFHRDCIDEWLDSHVTCPVCRASLVPKPSQLCCETELTGGMNKHTKDHVSVEVVDLKHDLVPPRKLSCSCSMGHPIENIDRYTLRLPNDVQNVLRNNGTQTRTRADVSLLQENGLKTSLKSASASYVRGSNYFDYERFGHERQASGRNFGITGSFISRSGSGSGVGSDVKDSTTPSKRFLTSVKSLNRLLQIPNKDTDMIMTRLNDS